MTKYKRKLLILFCTSCVLLVLGLLHFIAISNSKEPETVTVKIGSIEQTAIAVGQIIPEHVVQVKSTTSGTVANILVHEGDIVKTGDVLLTIKPNPTPEDLTQAITNMEQNRAVAQNAAKHLDRESTLFKYGAVSAQDYDDSKKDSAVAKWQLRQAEEKYHLLAKGEASINGNTIHGVVYSPANGYIIQKNVDIGDAIVPLTQSQAGTPLFYIADMQDLVFQGEISQLDIGKIEQNMPATIEIAALPDIKIPTQIAHIAFNAEAENFVDQNSSQYIFHRLSTYKYGFKINTASLSLPNNIKLRAGCQATATIIVGHANNVLVLPEKVINFSDDGKYYVWLLQKNKPIKVFITTGISDGMDVEILTGLNIGQKVLLNPPEEN